MTQQDVPTSADFWKAFEGWKLFVRECFYSSQSRLLRSEARPGQRYNPNIHRRFSDGKLFASDDRKYNEDTDQYYWTLIEVPDISNSLGKSWHHDGLERVDSKDYTGNVNCTMRIDGELYECAASRMGSDWAWYDVPPVDPNDNSWPRKDSCDELHYAKSSHEHSQVGITYMEAIEGGREVVNTWLESGFGDIRSLYVKLGLPRDAHVPDDGAISAAITRLRHYQKTGELISVCY